MGSERELLERIASALERMAPQPAGSVDWLSAPAFVWDKGSALPVTKLDALPLDQLRGIEDQKQALCENMGRLARGAAAHDMLLWGARGAGKSALVRAAVADIQAHQPDSLALVQVSIGSLSGIPALLEMLAGIDRAFLLFIDDLGFGSEDLAGNLALRSVLDGGAAPRPANVRLAVTTNRRAIIGQESAGEDVLHERDERDSALALADRFGLTLGFHPCDRATYLEIIRSYTDPLGLEVDEEEALAWSIDRGNRSGRTAYQFAVELAGRAGKVV